MRVASGFLKLGVCLILVASASLIQAMEVNINFLLGRKGLESDDWANSALGVNADAQPVFGAETTFGSTSWPVAIVDLRLSTAEVSLFGQDVQAGGAMLGLPLGWG